MGPKEQVDVKEYCRGLSDATNDKPYNDGSDGFTAIVTLGMAGGSRENSDSYREGYKDGKNR